MILKPIRIMLQKIDVGTVMEICIASQINVSKQNKVFHNTRTLRVEILDFQYVSTSTPNKIQNHRKPPNIHSETINLYDQSVKSVIRCAHLD